MAARKVTVILDDPKHWDEWIQIIRSIAINADVWDFIDPGQWTSPDGTVLYTENFGPATIASSNTADGTHRLLRYTRSKHLLIPMPEYPDATDVNPAKQTLSALDEKETKDYNHLKSLYKVEESKYSRRAIVLTQLYTMILESVDRRYLHIIRKCENVRELLVSLQRRFKKTDLDKEREVQDLWDGLMKGPKGKMDNWLDDCLSAYEQALDLNLPFTFKSRTAKEFIFALPRGGIRDSISRDYRKSTMSGKTVELRDVVDEYRGLYNDFIAPGKKTSESAFVTFNGQQLEGSKRESEKSQPQNATQRPNRLTCACGDKHKFSNCPYVCPSARPNGWKRDNEIWQRMEKLFEEKPTIKAAADRAAEADSKKQTESGKGNGKNNSQSVPQDRNKKENERTANLIMTTIYRGPTPSESNEDSELPDDFILASSDMEEQHDRLADSFILDSGATIHVCNDINRFVDFKESKNKSKIKIGDTYTHVVGWGKVKILATPINGTERVPITLQSVAFIPHFGCNIVSLRVIMRRGFKWNPHKGIITQGRKQICRVEDHHNMFTVEYNEIDTTKRVYVAQTRRSFFKAESKTTAEIWHKRMGHAHYEAIRHLPSSTEGVKLVKQPNDEDVIQKCESCRCSKPKKLVSRVTPERADKPWEKTHIDLIKANPGYNDSTQILHFYCDATRSHRVVDLKYHKDDPLNNVREAIYQFLAWVHTQFGYNVKILQTDQESALGKEFRDTIQINGLEWHTSAAYMHEQNGRAERSGRMLTETSRTMHIDSNIPKDLWPATYKCAAYLLNRTPTRGLNWKTPYEVVFERIGMPGKRPYIGHLKIFGTRVYEMIPTELIKRKDKMAARALIGYLVGYESTNQFEIWNPREGTVTKRRDVTFDEDVRYDPKNPYVEDLLVEAVPRLTTVIEMPTQPALKEYEFNDTDSEEEVIQDQDSTPESIHETPESIQNESLIDGAQSEKSYVPYMTPELTPEPARPAEQSEDSGPAQNITADQLTDQERPKAPRDINANLTTDNIVKGPRNRTPRRDKDYVYQARLAQAEEKDIFYAMFTNGMTHQDHTKIHRDQLPPEPESMAQAMRHPLKEGWMDAATLEINSLSQLKTFEKVEIPEGKQVIPVKWVFNYKFDSDGNLIKLKARLCVRGDLQIQGRDDTYAATLAAKTFRACMSIAAVFNLDAHQYDVVNAFLNSKLDEEVYVRMPDGFSEAGMCWLLLKALYGLRRSPRLWQQEFGSWLYSMNFKSITENPCVYTNDYATIIFFVDDIVVLSLPVKRHRVRNFEDALKEKYPTRVIGELKWFLGIRVIRDREARKLWLCQDSYVDKIVSRFHLEDGKRPPTPMIQGYALTPNQDKATPKAIHQYQAKVGSVLYPTIITRPDCAYAASKLSEHLQNPSQQHIDAVDRLIKHLDGTKTLAIEFSVDNLDESVIFATDAAFADNRDRKSSEGYVMKMFGGVVDWKACKQKTVTTSTTEAELLSLSNGARETYWWMRFFDAITLNLEKDVEIWCDNQQTVGLLTKIDPELKTKMRHVDIHHHWLRQEVQHEKVRIRWKSTNHMPADGMTKSLSTQKHQEFVGMLGLRDIKDLISTSLFPNPDPAIGDPLIAEGVC